MTRREFVELLSGTVAAWPFVAHAQQGAPRHIGVLGADAIVWNSWTVAFVARLSAKGHERPVATDRVSMADSRFTPKATHELRSFAVMHNSLIQCCLGYSHTLTFHRDVVIAKDFGESKNAAYYEICGKLSEEDSLIWIKETNHATCFHLALGASFWRTMMYTLKGIIIIVTIITGSSLAMALNGPATSGQPSVAGSVAGNPAALQHLAQSTPGGVKSGSASNRRKHKHGKYKKTSG